MSDWTLLRGLQGSRNFLFFGYFEWVILSKISYCSSSISEQTFSLPTALLPPILLPSHIRSVVNPHPLKLPLSDSPEPSQGSLHSNFPADHPPHSSNCSHFMLPRPLRPRPLQELHAPGYPLDQVPRSPLSFQAS